MADVTTLKQAVEQRGPFAVWDLLSEDEQHEAAVALWQNSDRQSRAVIEAMLAKELKFRTQSVRRLPADRVASRLVRMAKDQPREVLFQYLFHLHLVGRKTLLAELLDALELPHEEGVLKLEDETEPPAAERVTEAAGNLVTAHQTAALIYLATLKVADGAFWSGVDPVLDQHGEDGAKLEE